MSREYIARDPRTGRPINVGGGRGRKKKVTADQGPHVALPPQVVIPLATGEIENYRVSWKEKDHYLVRNDGIKALANLSGKLAYDGHQILIESLMDSDPEVRIAALSALPSVAETCPDELFDYLSVLLDDKKANVRAAASQCLKRVAPIFPSATESTLAFELRHNVRARSKKAFEGLSSLCETWPEVACDHIDELLQDEDLYLRRSAAGLLRKVLHRGGAAACSPSLFSAAGSGDFVAAVAAGGAASPVRVGFSDVGFSGAAGSASGASDDSVDSGASEFSVPDFS